MPGTPASKAMRAVCVTLWADKPKCIYDVQALPEGLQYIYVGGEETCPDTGNKHKHVYAYGLKRGFRLGGWTRIFGTQCHVEQARGTHDEAINYCKKEAEGYEFGERPMENGVQKGRHVIVQLMEEGERPMKIARVHGNLTETVARYNNFWEKMWMEIQTEKMNKEGFKPKQVFILQGATGTGKTRQVYEQYGFENVYRAVCNSGKWFDGYNGQPAVVFDECSAGAIMPVTQWLTITDGYPLSVPVKGGFVPFRPESIYFTTNTDYRIWWSDICQEHLAAVKRRVTEIRVFKADGSVVFE